MEYLRDLSFDQCVEYIYLNDKKIRWLVIEMEEKISILPP